MHLRGIQLEHQLHTVQERQLLTSQSRVWQRHLLLFDQRCNAWDLRLDQLFDLEPDFHKCVRNSKWVLLFWKHPQLDMLWLIYSASVRWWAVPSVFRNRHGLQPVLHVPRIQSQHKPAPMQERQLLKHNCLAEQHQLLLHHQFRPSIELSEDKSLHLARNYKRCIRSSHWMLHNRQHP